MIHANAQPDPLPEPGSPSASEPDNVAYLHRPDIRPVPPPALSRAQKLLLTALFVLTGLTLAAAGTSAATSPAGSGDVSECATQCPM